MRTTIRKKRTNKIRISFLLSFAIGVVIGRFAPKWLSNSSWNTIIEMIAAAIESTETVSKTYLTVFSAAFASELMLLLTCFSFAAIPVMMLFFLCCGIGIGTALTAYFAVFQGHGLLFGVLVLGPQMVGSVCTLIFLAETALKAAQQVFLSLKSEKHLDFSPKTEYCTAVKILYFTVVLAMCSLYFALMKHYFTPVLP